MTLAEITNDEIRFAVEVAVEKRQEAARMEKEAEALKNSANEILLPLLECAAEPKVQVPGVGTVSVMVTSRSSFDKDYAKEQLVLRGCPADVVAAVFMEATTYSPETKSVRFTPEKVK